MEHLGHNLHHPQPRDHAAKFHRSHDSKKLRRPNYAFYSKLVLSRPLKRYFELLKKISSGLRLITMVQTL